MNDRLTDERTNERTKSTYIYTHIHTGTYIHTTRYNNQNQPYATLDSAHPAPNFPLYPYTHTIPYLSFKNCPLHIHTHTHTPTHSLTHIGKKASTTVDYIKKLLAPPPNVYYSAIPPIALRPLDYSSFDFDFSSFLLLPHASCMQCPDNNLVNNHWARVIIHDTEYGPSRITLVVLRAIISRQSSLVGGMACDGTRCNVPGSYRRSSEIPA